MSSRSSQTGCRVQCGACGFEEDTREVQRAAPHCIHQWMSFRHLTGSEELTHELTSPPCPSLPEWQAVPNAIPRNCNIYVFVNGSFSQHERVSQRFFHMATEVEEVGGGGAGSCCVQATHGACCHCSKVWVTFCSPVQTRHPKMSFINSHRLVSKVKFAAIYLDAVKLGSWALSFGFKVMHTHSSVDGNVLPRDTISVAAFERAQQTPCGCHCKYLRMNG